MTRRLLVLALVAAGSAVLAATASSSGRARSSLQRPLHLPHVASGARCPVSHVDGRIPFVRRFGVAVGIGQGPAYPIGIPKGRLDLAPARNFDSRKWAGQKVLWLVLPRYRGPVLIRGGRIDRPGRVRFDSGNVPPLSLRIGPTTTSGNPTSPVPPPGTRYRPSFTRVRGPGCYAYQIDGTSFSRVVVFRAV
ncbi:MAG TPA: hypothetical protein VJ814_07735 [Gaiellaceae bacterium]|nr:hypothetical protein [Gaiellaceae bacterium]